MQERKYFSFPATPARRTERQKGTASLLVHRAAFCAPEDLSARNMSAIRACNFCKMQLQLLQKRSAIIAKRACKKHAMVPARAKDAICFLMQFFLPDFICKILLLSKYSYPSTLFSSAKCLFPLDTGRALLNIYQLGFVHI